MNAQHTIRAKPEGQDTNQFSIRLEIQAWAISDDRQRGTQQAGTTQATLTKGTTVP